MNCSIQIQPEAVNPQSILIFVEDSFLNGSGHLHNKEKTTKLSLEGVSALKVFRLLVHKSSRMVLDILLLH
jgi:hypothetical protein